jgi:hypothetical protein
MFSYVHPDGREVRYFQEGSPGAALVSQSKGTVRMATQLKSSGIDTTTPLTTELIEALATITDGMSVFDGGGPSVEVLTKVLDLYFGPDVSTRVGESRREKKVTEEQAESLTYDLSELDDTKEAPPPMVMSLQRQIRDLVITGRASQPEAVKAVRMSLADQSRFVKSHRGNSAEDERLVAFAMKGIR